MAMEITIHDRMVKNEPIWNFKGQVDYVDEWFLMGSPFPILMVMIGYWSFVLKLGPAYMKNKLAYNISKVLSLYNIFQIIYSFYLSWTGINILLTYGLIHTSCLMEQESIKFVITSGSYAYLLAKISELLDTVFFVLKKNTRQITFLHVYHHSVMLIFTWTILKYEPSYSTVFLGTINSCVHVIMYTYYFLSAFPQLAKYLWWKKYITKMQITQFILIIIEAAVSYCTSGCPPSYTLLTVIIFNAILFTALFLNFYINSYKETKKVD